MVTPLSVAWLPIVRVLDEPAALATGCFIMTEEADVAKEMTEEDDDTLAMTPATTTSVLVAADGVDDARGVSVTVCSTGVHCASALEDGTHCSTEELDGDGGMYSEVMGSGG